MSTHRIASRPFAHIALTVSLALGLAIAAGCDDEAPAPGGTCGASGRAGRTTCIALECNVGQYCDMSTAPTCTPGCTSDTNCGPAEFCARPAGAAIGACESCPVCGNGLCDGGESAATCARDCGGAPSACGNGRCDAGETTASCAADCPAAAACGNGRCEAGESASTCIADCRPPAVCGDGRCETGESTSSCSADCKPVCGDAFCDAGETPQTCSADCKDLTLDECLGYCLGYEVQMCFVDSDQLLACKAACTAATTAKREAFNTCARRPGFCDLSCIDKLR